MLLLLLEGMVVVVANLAACMRHSPNVTVELAHLPRLVKTAVFHRRSATM
jgi:hypothetical protein